MWVSYRFVKEFPVVTKCQLNLIPIKAMIFH